MTLGLTHSSTPEQVAAALINECRRRGYTRDECIAVVSTGKQESGLRMVWHPNGLWYGYFQQDASYPNRLDPNGNALGFLDRLDVKRRSPGASDIWKNIFWLQQRPSEPNAERAYANGRKAYLTEIQRHIAWAAEQYDRVVKPVESGRFWPLADDGIITSPYGPRTGGFHYGVDFGRSGGSANMPVHAVREGKVIHAGAAQGYGGPDPAGWLVILGPDGECWEYGHIIREVGVGDHVVAGQRIARINPDRNTNGGTAPHLHVSFMPNGYNPNNKVDPLPRLSGARHPGSTSPHPGTPKPPPPPVRPAHTELDFWSHKRVGQGMSVRSRPPINFFIHTEEGNGTAESLARFCDGSNGVSYHYTLRDGILCAVVDTDYYSWSVLNANVFSINLCFAGSFAGWTREQWLKRERDIEIAAWVAVQDCRKYGFSTEVIAPPYGGARPGISDHNYVTKVLSIGTHWDVGPNFPWDVFARYVNKFTNGEGGDELTPEQDRMLRELHGALFNRVPSQSLYADPGEAAKWQLHELIKNVDGMSHEERVEQLARQGDPDSISRIVRVARGQGRVTEQWAIDRATRALTTVPTKILEEWEANQ